HVERVFITHVDDGGADLDLLGAGADGGEQRKGRSELTGEMVDAEIGAIGPKLFGGNGQIDGLQQHISGGARLGIRRGAPMAEGKETDLRLEEHTSELQSRENLVCRLLLE